MRKKRIAILTVAGFFGILLISLALLPSILSSHWGQKQVLGSLNQRIPGKLQVKGWSLSWFSALSLEKVVYEDIELGIRARLAQVKTDRGLFKLLTSPANIGLVQITEPLVTVDLAVKTTRPFDRSSKAPEQPHAPKTQKIPPVTGHLKIINGSLRTIHPEKGEKIVVKGLNADLVAQGLDQPIQYQLLMKSGDGTGHASGQGSFHLATDDPANLNALRADANLDFDNWELSDLFALAAQGPNYPAGKGRLNFRLTLKGKLSEGIELKSNVAIPELQLWGGPFKSDRPKIENFSVDLNAVKRLKDLNIKQLRIGSSIATASVKGLLADVTQNQFDGTFKVDLAEVFNQFPDTLNLQKGTRISDGELALTAKVDTHGDVTRFNANARIDRLKGTSGGKRLSWDQPVTATAKGEQRPKGLWLENFSVRAPFFKGDGQGDFNNMRLTLAADLQAGLRELKKFIQIKEWSGSGNLQAKIQMQKASETSHTATLALTVDDFALTRNQRQVAPRQNIRADLKTNFRIGQTSRKNQISRTNIIFASLFGNGRLKTDAIHFNRPGGLPDIKNLTFDGDFDLKRLTTLLNNLDLLPRDIRLAGKSHLSTQASLANDKLALAETTVDTQKLVFQEGSKAIREDRLTVKTKGQIHLKNRSVHLAPVTIDSQAGRIQIADLTLADWADLQKDVKATATTDLNLTKAARGYGAFLNLPPKMVVAGNAKFNLNMDFSGPKTQFLKLNGDIAPLKISSPDLPAISEKKITITADVKRNAATNLLSLDKLQLVSNMLSLAAAGSLNQSPGKNALDLKGTLTPDFGLLANLMGKQSGKKISIAGKAERPFQLKMASKTSIWADPLQKINFNGTFFVQSLKMYGMDIAPGDIGVNVTNGVARINIDAAANEGRLTLQPTLDMRRKPYVLKIPENSDIAKNVNISNKLTSDLLASVHPIFKGASVSIGSLGLASNHFNLPLDEKYTKAIDITGRLNLNEVAMDASPLLATILKFAGIKESTVDLGNVDIEFQARNGRVASSPVNISAGDFTMMLQGSMGFDKTLDYLAKIPVTRKLVGRKAYKYLQGVTIDVPIGGTVGKPRIDERAVEKVTSGLVKQALQQTLEKQATDLLQKLFKK
jgi:hypothetical protein